MSNYNVIIPHYSVMLADGLAKIIQEQYDFRHEISMELLASAMNDIYRVRSGEYTYYIRIPRHERFWPFSKETYTFELDLLNFLRKHDIPVAYPIPTKNKSYLGILNAPEGIRYYAMYTEARGEEPEVSNPDHMQVMGRYLGRLHQTTGEYQSRATGLHWDLHLLVNHGMTKLREYLPPDLKKDFSWLTKKTSALVSHFNKLVTRDEWTWGIIHGGYTPKNLRIRDGQITAFDFEYCGHGYRIFDLVFMLNKTNLLKPDNTFFQAFLAGYQEERTLSDAEIEALPIISRLALISQTTVSAGMRDLVGVLWFDKKLRHDIELLKKIL